MYLEIIKALEGTPEMDDELGLYNKVGDLYLKMQNVNAAVDLYERAVNRYTESGFPNNAIALCNKILRSAPGRTHIYLKLAQLMAQRGFVAEAKKNFVEYADRMSAAGKLDEAFAALKRFADMSPENEEIRLMLAEQFRAAARDDDAREQVEKLIKESGAGGPASEVLEKVRAVDPEYDVDSGTPAPAPPARSKTDLIFISLDDDEEPAQPEPEPEPIADLEPTAIAEPPAVAEAGPVVTEDVGIVELEQAPSVDEPVAGLETGSGVSDGLVEVEPLEIETTSLVSEDVGDLELGTSIPNLITEDQAPAAPPLEPAVPAAPEDVTLPVTPLESPDEVDLGEVILDTGGALELEEPAPAAGTPSAGLDLSGDIDLMPIAEPVSTEPTGAELVADLEGRVASDPDDPMLHRQLAEALLETGDRERGLQELEIALERSEAREEWRRASDLASEILRLEPNSIPHHQKRVEVTYRAGDRAELIAAYLEMANALFRTGALDRAEAIYRRVLEQDPGNQVAQNGLATMAPATPEPPPPPPPPPPAAIEPAAPAAPPPASPAPPPPPPEPVAAPTGGADYVDLGDLIMGEETPHVKDTRMRIEEDAPTGDEEHDFSQMLQQFKRGIEENLDDEDSQAHYDLGVAFKEMGLLDEAIAEFQKSLRGEDTRLSSAEMLGHCFMEKGQYEVASTVLRRAVDGDGKSDQEKVGLLYWLGRCEQENQRPSEALKYYQRVFAVDIHFQDVSQRVDALVKAGG